MMFRAAELLSDIGICIAFPAFGSGEIGCGGMGIGGREEGGWDGDWGVGGGRGGRLEGGDGHLFFGYSPLSAMEITHWGEAF